MSQHLCPVPLIARMAQDALDSGQATARLVDPDWVLLDDGASPFRGLPGHVATLEFYIRRSGTVGWMVLYNADGVALMPLSFTPVAADGLPHPLTVAVGEHLTVHQRLPDRLDWFGMGRPLPTVTRRLR